MRAALLAVALLAMACTTPLALGERRYREGDRLGALEIWRSVSPDSLYYEAVRERIDAVEDEFDRLVVRYKKRGRYFERTERLAESILNHRLALELQPDDRATLAHVQQLVRRLDARKRETERQFEVAFGAGDLPAAREALDSLRRLDPFDPRLSVNDQRLDAALRGEVDGLLARGRRGFSSGDLAHAEEAFQAVLALEPDNEAARGYLAYVADQRTEDARSAAGGRAPAALRASEREIRAEGLYRNALRAERAGRPFTAIRHDLRALALAPGHSGAARHLRTLRSRLAPRVDALIEEGRVHYEQEELESALDDWRRALLVDPQNGRAREYVARAERLLENLEQLRAEPEPALGTR